MGHIKRFDLESLRTLTKAPYFFETGTWRGDGLAYAAQYPFEKLYSSEIIPSIAEKAKERFKQNNKVTIIEANSIAALQQALPAVKGNCIFWLDAHFPGAEEGLNDYNAFEEGVKLPLEKELELIAPRVKTYDDIILIDDLRIYEDGSFSNGNLPAGVWPPQVRNIQFVYKLFQPTHDILKFYNDEGYIAVVPKAINIHQLRQAPFRKLVHKLRKKIL